eukprot:TRINITY_DN3248_c0_g1_i1.p1 TRINITY_DN3248_c0_g1~~TRINITY_DN3248_c0_g1_i1.p1  ORF type:complete len:131 (+),score=18.41 TRINITY_DN3248_c0_g1_i1:334-726(+)
MESDLLSHNVVIFADTTYDKNELIAFNKICRQNNIKFMWCFTIGITAHMMNDFGADVFRVHDVYGGNLSNGEIVDIEVIEEKEMCIIYTRTEHKLRSGRSFVSFHEMKGAEELSANKNSKLNAAGKIKTI